MIAVNSCPRSNANRQSFAAAVVDAITAATVAASDASVSLNFDEGEDSDGWLNIDEDMLNGMLVRGSGSSWESKLGPSQNSNIEALSPENGGTEEDGGEDAITTEQADRLKKLAGKVEAFVEGEGDLEGARFDE